jgi:ABC-type transport system involved in multi-copper enzyme maturation permease subunit
MVQVFIKEIKKAWIMAFAPPILFALLIPLIAYIWPELEAQAAAFAEILESPLYQGILGDLLEFGFTSWEGMYFLYIFMMIEFVVLFTAIFIPAYFITSEAEKGTLDVMLSYPIPRWRFILEKFLVYAVNNLVYLIILIPMTFFFTESIQEPFNYDVLLYALIGIWVWFFTFGAISFLCGAIFIETKKAVSIAGLFIVGQYIMQRLGGISEGLNILKDLSIFNYLSAAQVYKWFNYPESYDFFSEFLSQLIGVAGIGLLALVTALFIFNRRELAY